MKRLFNKMFLGKGVRSFLPLVMLIVCSTLGTTDAWAGDSNNYTKLKVKPGTSSAGYVYADNAKDAAIAWTNDSEVETETLSSGYTHYAWAEAFRGSEFTGWSNKQNITSISGSNPYSVVVTKPTNNKGDTKTGEITATWTTYKPCTVHLHASADGAYRLDYSYTDWNGADAFEPYDKVEILSTGGEDQDVQLYYTDQVRLSVTSGTFQGWYEDAEFTQPLTEATGSGPYTLAIPNSTTSETEMHIYPKFQTQPKLFGRVNLDFAYGNATDCGYIGITEVVDAEVNYSGTPISCTHISLVADASTPTSQTYYLHAKPVNVEQNAFVGWFSSQIPSQSSLLSTELDYAYTFDASSTDASAPTIQNVYALFMRISTHYFEMTTEPGEAGLGMVYASQTNATKPDYTYFSNYSQVLAEEIYLAGKDANTNFYLYAKPKYGYQFEGWYSDADCTVKVSGNNPYTYAASISSTDPNNPDKAHFYAKFVPATPISVTFEYPTTEGSYNVKAIDIVVSDDGEYEWGETTVLYNSAEETANKTIQIYPTDNLNFTAIPNAGNAVKSWKIAGANVTSGSNNYTAAATNGKAYGVTFGASAPFMVGSQTYSTLDAAISHLGTNKTIFVVEDATVAAGHYTIPSGVTLLVPFDDANTITTNHNSMVLENVGRAYNAARTCYRMLTLDPGVIIDVQGSINVGANIASASGNGLGCGSINTAYGRIDMKSGSQINLKNGSNLYCWGIISGTDGLVTAESGSTVHEMLQHQSNPGGSAALGWDYKAFFMNQYYFQNVEAPLRINYGATEKVYAELYIQGFKDANASLIGSDGLFRVNDASSYIIKTYDPSTDRTIYDMYGNASMVSLSMKVYVEIDTKKYPMPINNNMTIRCHSNGNASTVTLTYDVDLYPSAKVIIDEGVTLLVKGKLNVYDRDEWVGKGFAHRDLSDIARASFSPTRTHNRTVAELEDAAIEVNGMMRVSGGLYTSTGKANIYSSGSGKILLEKSPSPTNAVYQYASNKYTGILVPFTAAYLKNGNGSFVSTADAAANTTYTYFLGEWKANLTIDGCFAVDDAGHKYIAIDGGYKDVKESTIYSNAWVSRDAESMLFVHTADNCDWLKVFAVEGTTTYLKDAEGNYYEYNSTNKYWVPATQYTVSFQNHKEKTIFSCNIFPNSKPVYAGATPVHPSDDEGQYTFIGWKKDGDETIYTTAELPTLNANTTFKAQFDVTPYVASITSLGVVSRYVDFASALTAANGMTTTPTLKLLSDVTGISASQIISTSMTLDLNGHELSGTVNKLIDVNAKGKIVTITDNSDEQTGLIATQVDENARCYCVCLTVGTLNIEGGTIRATNEAEYVKGTTEKTQASAVYVATKYTCNISGGRLEAYSTYYPAALYVAAAATTTGKAYITGGELYAESTQAGEPNGIYTLGTVEMSGGTVTALSKTTNARGAQAAASSSKYAGTFTMTGGTINAYSTTTGATGVYATVANKDGVSYAGEVNVQGGEITATAGTNTAYGVYVSFAGTGAANTKADPIYYYYSTVGRARGNISGGTITAKTAAVNGSTPAATCYGVYSLGETEITGGTITARPTTNTAYGVYSADGSIHISGNPTILAEATTKAYGAYAGHYYPSTFKLGYMGLGNLIIDDGDITARTTSTTTAYGLYVSAVSKAISSTSSGYYPNPTPYVGYGSAIVNGGTITAIAKTTTSVAIYTAAPVTGIVAAKNTAEAISESETVEPVVNINGGKFKAFANLTTPATCLTVTGTNNSVSLSGGYYGLNTNLNKYVAAPNRVLDCQDAELMDTYPYEVGEGYKVTFKNGSTVLQEGYVKVGATPAYTGATPVKDADAQYTYTFSTWSPAISAVSNADQEYTAQFDQAPKSYTLAWDLNGGDITTPGTAAGSVAFGTELTAPVVEKTGYSFNGWNPAVPATMPAANATYTAQWQKLLQVIYNANGHGTAPASLEVVAGQKLTEPTAPTATGYTFGGWYQDQACTEAKKWNFSSMLMGDASMMLYAKWTPETYTISYNANYEDAASIYETKSVTYDAQVGALRAMSDRDSHTFLGWYDAAEGGNMYTTTTMYTTDGNKTLYAHWQIKTYTITWKDGDGKTLKTTSVEHGTTPSYDGANPTKTTDAAYSYAWNNGWTPAPYAANKAETYTATFESTANVYHVTYNMLGHGTAPAQGNVAYDALVTAPATPQATGYAFGGWYKDENCTTAWNFASDKMPARNLVLYAKWTINQYTISFSMNGAESGPIDPITQDYSTSVSAPTTTPKKTGYTFAGWSPAVPATMPASNTNCVAQWTENQYSIELNTNGHGASTMINNVRYTANQSLSGYKPVNKGYAFLGWATAADGEVVYAEDASVSRLSATNGATVTLYAKWSENRYSIEFDANGATGEMAGIADVPYAHEQQLTKNAFTMTGYHFANWQIERENVGGASAPARAAAAEYDYYDDEAMVSKLRSTNGAMATMVAQWEENTYTIAFNANGGSGSMTALTGVRYSESKVLTANTFEREGYTFAGWALIASGAKVYNDGASVLRLTAENDVTVTLYAKWTPNKYTYMFYDADGTTELDKKTQDYESSLSAITTPSKYGYVFQNWTPAVPTKMPLNGGSSNAVWTKGQYAVTFVVEGAQVQQSLVEYEAQVTYAGATPEKDKTTANTYTFRAWKSSKDNQEYTTDHLPAMGGEAVTYTAMFDEHVRQYHISVLSADETMGYTIGTGYYDYNSTQTITAVANKNYKFVRWADEAEEAETVGSSRQISVISAAEYTAIFKLNNIEVDNKTVAETETLVIEAGQTMTVTNDLIIEPDGGVEIGIGGTIAVGGDFVICANEGSNMESASPTKYGKSIKSDVNMSQVEITGSAYFDLKLTCWKEHDDDPSYSWHAFSVPFPVNLAEADALQGDNHWRSTPGYTNLVFGKNYSIQEYDGAARAAGNTRTWKTIDKTSTLLPGKFYLMTVDGYSERIRFKKTSGTFVTSNEVAVAQYPSSVATTEANWNGLGNPNLGYRQASVSHVSVLDPVNYVFKTVEAGSLWLATGAGFFVQAATDATVVRMSASAPVSVAARVASANNHLSIAAYLSNSTYTDNLYLEASDDAQTTYQLGHDLTKMRMEGNNSLPQIAATAYGTELAVMSTPWANDQAVFPLSLYAPQTGTYTISVEETDEDVYLLQNGNPIANLSYGNYSLYLNQGNSYEYSIGISRRRVATDLNENEGADDHVNVQKIYWNKHIYILRDGQMYDATGKLVK